MHMFYLVVVTEFFLFQIMGFFLLDNGVLIKLEPELIVQMVTNIQKHVNFSS